MTRPDFSEESLRLLAAVEAEGGQTGPEWTVLQLDRDFGTFAAPVVRARDAQTAAALAGAIACSTRLGRIADEVLVLAVIPGRHEAVPPAQGTAAATELARSRPALTAAWNALLASRIADVKRPPAGPAGTPAAPAAGPATTTTTTRRSR